MRYYLQIMIYEP